MADHLPYLSLDQEGSIVGCHAVLGLGLSDIDLIGKNWQDIFVHNPQLGLKLGEKDTDGCCLPLISKQPPHLQFDAFVSYDAALRQWKVFLLLPPSRSVTTFASPEYLQALLDCTTDSTMLIGLDYRILGFNKKTAEMMLTLRGTEMKVGDSIFEYDDPNLREIFVKTFQEVVQTHREVIHQSEVKQTKGIIWVRVKYTPVFPEMGS